MAKSCHMLVLLLILACLQTGMARHGQYDEEAREAEQIIKQEEKANPSPKKKKSRVKNFATGVKEATVDSTSGLISETAEGSKDSPVLGTLEGARKGTGKVLDSTVKGAVKVVTLGYADTTQYEVQEPEKGKDEPTKIKFKF